MHATLSCFRATWTCLSLTNRVSVVSNSNWPSRWFPHATCVHHAFLKMTVSSCPKNPASMNPLSHLSAWSSNPKLASGNSSRKKLERSIYSQCALEKWRSNRGFRIRKARLAGILRLLRKTRVKNWLTHKLQLKSVPSRLGCWPTQLSWRPKQS